MKNFYPKQYKNDSKLNINHNYLNKQFSDYNKIFNEIKKIVINTDYTLGKNVDIFEEKFAKLIGTKFAIGVGSGTDALFLSLKALNVKPEDEIITTAFTFYATVGAIVTAGCKPVLVDIKEDLNIDEDLIVKKINKKTKAIIPVHWSGKPCDMEKLNFISKKYKIPIIEDSCHAICAKFNNKNAGSFGLMGCFSFHPLKNLNVWGDGGMICTNSKKYAIKLRLLRNHGLINRNRISIYGYNSRLDTLQATVGLYLLKKIKKITDARIKNSLIYDKKLKKIKNVVIPDRDKKNIKQVYHIYTILVQNRDQLCCFLNKKGIDAKIHYPIPMHLQKPSKEFGYKKGDFKKAELMAKKVLSLPVHEFVTIKEINYVCYLIEEFYNKG